MSGVGVPRPSDSPALPPGKPSPAGDDELIATSFDVRPFPKRKTKGERGLCAKRGCLNPSRAKGQTLCHTHYAREARARRRAKGLSLWPSAHRNKAAAVRGMVWAAFSEEQWLAMYEAQGGKCAICDAPLKNRWRTNDPAPEHARQAHVDHCHSLEKELRDAGMERDEALRRSARGLLCWMCNRLLVRHWTPARLIRAAEYVTDMPAQRVLGGM